MTQSFDKNPILNSPYRKPEKHWNLDERGKPTGGITNSRRMSVHMVPIPESRRSRRRDRAQADLEMNEEKDNPIINLIRQKVDDWRPVSEEDKRLTYVTRRLLSHWRSDAVDPRPFFCQLEAVETFIWLNEVAPKIADGKRILADLADMNRDANSELFRLAAKMATGSGKTRVMAMMIAYHTINKARMPGSPRFSNSFLIVTPRITIKDRLRVLYPSDPSNLYTGDLGGRNKGIIPTEFIGDIGKANILVTNYHSFGHREKLKISKGTREVLQGNEDESLSTKEFDCPAGVLIAVKAINHYGDEVLKIFKVE